MGIIVLDPERDSVDHINVYSKGRTTIGRWMSNFTHSPFEHPRHGYFESVEGLWYWLSCKDDRLRHLSGFAAKKLGRELRAPDWVKTPLFKEDITLGIQAKLDAHPQWAELIKHTRLPLMHYYVRGGRITDLTRETRWMLDVYDKWRKS